MQNIDITKEEFLKYDSVRKSGKYNMLGIRAIEAVGLPKEKYFNIITNYDKYAELYIDGE